MTLTQSIHYSTYCHNKDEGITKSQYLIHNDLNPNHSKMVQHNNTHSFKPNYCIFCCCCLFVFPFLRILPPICVLSCLCILYLSVCPYCLYALLGEYRRKKESTVSWSPADRKHCFEINDCRHPSTPLCQFK